MAGKRYGALIEDSSGKTRPVIRKSKQGIQAAVSSRTGGKIVSDIVSDTSRNAVRDKLIDMKNGRQ